MEDSMRPTYQRQWQATIHLGQTTRQHKSQPSDADPTAGTPPPFSPFLTNQTPLQEHPSRAPPSSTFASSSVRLATSRYQNPSPLPFRLASLRRSAGNYAFPSSISSRLVMLLHLRSVRAPIRMVLVLHLSAVCINFIWIYDVLVWSGGEGGQFNVLFRQILEIGRLGCRCIACFVPEIRYGIRLCKTSFPSLRSVQSFIFSSYLWMSSEIN